jgi:hypothetical protein
MQLIAALPLAAWTNFYVIAGTAAGALIGLTFVSITLVAGRRTHSQASGMGIATFTTPSVVHFCLVLLMAAMLSVPWDSLSTPGVLLILIGLGGLTYSVIITRRLRRMEAYKPVLEDWLLHSIFPLTAYAALAIAGITLTSNPALALFIVAAVMLALMFIAIHNVWDTATYITIEFLSEADEREE